MSGTITNRRAWLPVDPAGIPRELVDDPAWYPAIIKPKAGKVGKWDKTPGDPASGKPATWSDPATRCTFGTAFMAYESGDAFAGVGYMMHDNGTAGIDVDDAFTDTGDLKPHAREIVNAFPGAYWERSISGTGLRGFCKGSLPVGGCRAKIDGCSVELYADVRFLVVTGHAIQAVDELPHLQDAVDALHARLSAGRERASGSAIVTGLTGPITSLSPEALDILSDVMAGRFGPQMAAIWERQDIATRGVSEQDWALECETAYHAIRRGYSGENLPRIVEEVVRAGPYRVKWDERRGHTTWLAQDVANALATVQKRLTERSGQVLDLDQEDTTPAEAAETPEQTIARLKRELARERAVGAVRQTVLRKLQAEHAELRACFQWLRELFSSRELSGNDKVALVTTAPEVVSAIERGMAEYDADGRPWVKVIAEGKPEEGWSGLADKAGLGADAHRAALERHSSTPKEPKTVACFDKKVTRAHGERADGSTGPIATIWLSPRAERVSELYALALEMPRQARNHGGTRVRACPNHPEADIALTKLWSCTACGQVVDQEGGGKTASRRFTSGPLQAVAASTPQPQVAVLPPVLANGHATGNGHDRRSQLRRDVSQVQPHGRRYDEREGWHR